MNTRKLPRRINLLRDSVAQRIAAGEVIDRPFSIVRELLDNAIDSGADHIDVSIENGGIDRIRITDNGSGMDSEDLKICYLPHSTSKIEEIEDLEKLSTLGFRGEALSSIAACALLKITSAPTGDIAGTIRIQDGTFLDYSPSKGLQGTSIEVTHLFHTLPARKKFLKRPSAEAGACKKMFIEKALPFNNLTFRFFQDNQVKLFFPRSSLQDRLLAAYPGILHKDLIHEIKTDSGPFSLTIIAGDPSLTRKDRRFIQLFLNNRKISDFSLVQAVEYGFSEYLPGGTYPIAFVFISMDPSFVDFNIHPAKKEVRIKNTSDLHHEIVSAITTFLRGYTYNFTKSTAVTLPQAKDFHGFSGFITQHEHPLHQGTYSDRNFSKRQDSLSEKNRLYTAHSFPETITYEEFSESESMKEPDIPFTYLGQVFELFLVVSSGEILYIIDQHASHEKILFNEFLTNTGSTQKLLVPHIFSIGSNVETLLRKNVFAYKKMGILLEELEGGQWALKGIPEKCSGQENIIINFIKSQEGSVNNLKTALYADMACKLAIKDGERLDRITAIELIKKTITLKNARCPHGRPLWFQISREELFKLVGRT